MEKERKSGETLRSSLTVSSPIHEAPQTAWSRNPTIQNAGGQRRLEYDVGGPRRLKSMELPSNMLSGSSLIYKGKSRWFVLEKDKLSWYRSATELTKKGIIMLNQITRVVGLNSVQEPFDGDREFLRNNKTGFVVTVMENHKKHDYYFISDSEDSTSLWMDQLEWGRLGFLPDPQKLPDTTLGGASVRPKEIAGEVRFSGCLKRKTTGGWKDRYIVLHDNKLVWYSSRPGNPDTMLGRLHFYQIRGIYPGPAYITSSQDNELPKGRLPWVLFIDRKGETSPLCFLAMTPMVANLWVDVLTRVKTFLLSHSDDNLFEEEDIDNDDAQEDFLVSKARLDALVSFVPRIVVKRFMKDPTPLVDVESSKMNGAVLFADISGFTTLAEELAKKGGGEGAEILCQHLNAYFGKLVELIHQYGGDVIKYAGDAFLALWVGQPKYMAMMACQCALKIQTHTAKYSADKITLTVHIGIGAGTVYGMHIGGVNDRWEYLIGGDPMLQIAAAESAAKSGEVVLHMGAYDKIKEHIIARAVPGHTDLWRLEDIINIMPAPAPIVLDPSLSLQPVLSNYIPSVVRKRIDFGLAQWMAELRRVTVLFAHLPSLTDFDTKAEKDILQAAFKVMQTTVFNYGGTVRQFIIDDKGSVLVAAFYVHDDDPVRAIKAALKMVAKLKDINVKCSCGVTTGKVFLGAVGSETRREFAMVGDTVNLAARLMIVAQSTVLCDNYSFQACQAHPHSRLSFKRLEPIMVKGKKTLIPIFSPFFQTSRTVLSNIHHRTSLGHSSLIGREQEKVLLLSAIDQLRSEELKRTIVVEGEEGIGKSQVIRYLLSRLRDRKRGKKDPTRSEPLIFEVPGDSIHSFSPLYSWQSCIIRLLLNVDHDDDEDDISFDAQHALQEHVVAILQKLPHFKRSNGGDETESWSNYGALLNTLLALKQEETESTQLMDSNGRMQKTILLIASILAYKADGRKIIILIDDGHWLDTASWEVIGELTNLVKSILVVVTRRLTISISSDLSRLLQLTKSQTVKLSPLSQDDTGRLLQHVLRARDVPETLTRLIHEKSNGNPFFSRNLAISLCDSGTISVEDDTVNLLADIKNPADIAFPDTVEDLVTSRIGRLPSRSQFVLKVASVIGMQFDLSMLMGVYPVPDEKYSLQSCVEELEHLDFLQEVSHANEGTYRFTQTVVRECCYNLLLFQQRRTLHTVIAEWYKEYVEDYRPFYFRLGYHWEIAENYQKSTFYYEKAGDESSRQSSNKEAITFYTRAIDMCPRAAAHAMLDANDPAYRLILSRIHNSIAEAYYKIGDMNRSMEHIEQALKALGLPMPTNNVMSVLMVAGRALKQTLKMKKSSTPSAEGPGTVQVQALVAYEILSQIYFILGQPTSMLNCCVRALSVVSEADACKATLARVYASLSVATRMLGETSDSQKHRARAVELSTSVPHLSTFARVLHMNALTDCMNGELLGVHTTLKSVLDLYDRMAQWRKWCESAKLMAQERYFSGEFQASFDYGQRLFNQGEKYNDCQAMTWGLIAKAKVEIVWGHLDDALASLIECERVATLDSTSALGDTPDIEVTSLLALVHVRLGNMAEAAQYVGVIMAKPDLHESLFHLCLMFADLGEVCFKLWIDDSTEVAMKETYREHINRLCIIYGTVSKLYPLAAPRSLVRKGQMEWMFASYKKCRQSWYDALYWAENIPSIPYERALVLYEIFTVADTDLMHEQLYYQAINALVRLSVPMPLSLLPNKPHNHPGLLHFLPLDHANQ